jgi:general secretion pathway protein D
VEDGGIIALGGLIQDTLTEGEQRVPFLGKIPILGNLFKVRSSRKIKTNLIVFIRPKILRDGAQAAIETNQKYDYVRGLQMERNDGKAQLLSQERQPTLPELTRPAPKDQPKDDEKDDDKSSPGAATEGGPAVAPGAAGETGQTPAPAETRPLPETETTPPTAPPPQQPRPRRPPLQPEPQTQ